MELLLRSLLVSTILALIQVAIAITTPGVPHASNGPSWTFEQLPPPSIIKEANGLASKLAVSSKSRCNQSNEFHCYLEDRCVPLEWRCDFIEQCLAGQDELGCVAAWCNFDRDNCYWLNSLASPSLPLRRRQQQQQLSQPPIESINHLLGLSLSPAFQAPDTLEQRSFWLRHVSNRANSKSQQARPLADLLETLSSSGGGVGNHASNQTAKFIFAPLHASATDLELAATRRAHFLIRRARLETPPIGRTNARCRLNFEFMLTVGTTSSLLVEGSLRLLARPTGQTGAPARLLWSHQAAADEQKEANWTVGVAELGHMSHFQLEIEAEMQAELGQLVARPDYKTDTSFRGALVALKWLKFCDCQWPQAQISLQLDELLETGSQDNNTSENLDSWTIEGEQSTDNELMASVGSSHCLADEFTCSNNICLPGARLCDFVDDCMGTHPEDEADELCSPLTSSSENFDKPNERHLQLFLTNRRDKFWHLTGNWSISCVKVRSSLTDAGQSEGQLPRVDHTSHTPAGSYLSLELPQVYPPEVPSERRSGFYWAAINSQWMEKSRESSGGECRLKLFYNLVSTHPRLLYAADQAPVRFSLALEHHTMRPTSNGSQQMTASKQVDAVLHSQQLVTTVNEVRPHVQQIEFAGVDYWRELNVRLHDQQPGDLFYVRILIFVEILDWRLAVSQRASFNLDDLSMHFGCGTQLAPVNLRQEKLFDQELLILLQPPTPLAIVPYNPIRDRLHRNHLHIANNNNNNKNNLWWSQTGPCQQQLENDNSPTTLPGMQQVEPQKLIIYVSCAFCVMIGFIAVIVFVLVPHVERAMMNYQDQIQLHLSGELSDVPASHAALYDHSSNFSGTTNSGGHTRTRRTFSFDSLTTTTGFSLAAQMAAHKSARDTARRHSQCSIASSSSTSSSSSFDSCDSHFEANTNLDLVAAARRQNANEARRSTQTGSKNLNARKTELILSPDSLCSHSAVPDKALELSGSSMATSSSSSWCRNLTRPNSSRELIKDDGA